MNYEGLATLTLRPGAVLVILMQAMGLAGAAITLASTSMPMSSGTVGLVVGGAAMNTLVGVLLLVLSRPLARLVTRGL